MPGHPVQPARVLAGVLEASLGPYDGLGEQDLGLPVGQWEERLIGIVGPSPPAGR
jgi:hypothetical protein